MSPTGTASPPDLYQDLLQVHDALSLHARDALQMADGAIVPEFGMFCRARAVSVRVAQHRIQELLDRHAPDSPGAVYVTRSSSVDPQAATTSVPPTVDRRQELAAWIERLAPHLTALGERLLADDTSPAEIAGRLDRLLDELHDRTELRLLADILHAGVARLLGSHEATTSDHDVWAPGVDGPHQSTQGGAE